VTHKRIMFVPKEPDVPIFAVAKVCYPEAGGSNFGIHRPNCGASCSMVLIFLPSYSHIITPFIPPLSVSLFSHPHASSASLSPSLLSPSHERPSLVVLFFLNFSSSFLFSYSYFPLLLLVFSIYLQISTPHKGLSYGIGFVNPKEIQENEMGTTCSMNGQKKNERRIFVGKLEGNRPLGRPRRR
jgi:hypothetical protein